MSLGLRMAVLTLVLTAVVHLAAASTPRLLGPNGNPLETFFGINISSPDLECRFSTLSPTAAAAGIASGDRVLRVGGVPVGNVGEMMSQILQHGPGSAIPLEIEHGATVLRFQMSVGGGPPRQPAPVAGALAGATRLQLTSNGRHALFLPPTDYTPQKSWPLLVLLHGAGGSADNILDFFSQLATRLGGRVLQVAVQSTRQTWGDIQSDEAAILEAVAAAKKRWNVDTANIFLLGHSAGGFMAAYEGIKLSATFRGFIVTSSGLSTDLWRFLTPQQIQTAQDRFIYITCGENDAPHLRRARELRAELEKIPCTNMTYVEIPGEGHVLNGQALSGLETWLIETLDTPVGRSGR